ncbi:MAG: hypothetical protein K2P78_14105 [Gemmataceae bacterium]|nr:hypothetical protein [Gemmataceae bacterium]
MDNGRNGDMGRVTIEARVLNSTDRGMVERGALPADQLRSAMVSGVVDTGAAMLVLPEAVARRLGLPKIGETSVRYADHRTAKRDVVGDVEIEYAGRRTNLTAVVEPNRPDALYGAILLESLDLLVDCVKRTAVPRDPDTRITEIE